MAQAMIRLLACVVLVLVVVVAEAQPNGPKNKMVQCQDRASPCFHDHMHCPDVCPRDCHVDCASCQPVCDVPSLLPPPPPEIIHPPTPPPPPTPTSAPPPPPTSIPPPPPTPTPSSSAPPPPPTSIPPPPPTPTPSSSPPPTPTGSPPPSTPTPPPEVSGKRVYCKNRNYTRCYRMEQRCPSSCPDQCEVDCVTCSPVCNCNRPGAVCQDPRFIGADGLTFYFHGKKDHDFCIVTDSNLHVNAHFIGRRNQNMKRDFTWVQSLGILFDNHQIYVGAKKTATWDNAVDHLGLAFDGQPIYLTDGEGAKWQPITTPGVSITRSHDTNSVIIEVEGNFQITATVVHITKKDSWIHKYGITDEDCFAHLDLGFKFYSLSGAVTGVLGQTYASNYVSRVKMGVDMPVLGGEKEFASSNLFSTDCAGARFHGSPSITSSKSVDRYSDLKCASGLDGRGVVCKK
ncbi:uncharacterized protein [Coffea arabica]|uniref:Uncharacterized protein n=1 Tax=Coffea arabica TaxID=13443 RepID=A0A6P6TZV4_COFAR|nr:uncharacterized protein LOC113706132 [Coffea arabica]